MSVYMLPYVVCQIDGLQTIVWPIRFQGIWILYFKNSYCCFEYPKQEGTSEHIYSKSFQKHATIFKKTCKSQNV